jgi:sugar phosphate isomerase/epimerase
MFYIRHASRALAAGPATAPPVSTVKMGMSQSCYRWTTYPSLRYDRPEFRAKALPLPYGVDVRPPATVDGWLDWTLDKAVELGLSPVYTTVLHLHDERDARAYRDKLEERGLEFIGSGGGGFATVGDEWRRVFAKFSHEMRMTRLAGGTVIAAVNADPEGPPGQPWPNGGTRFGHFSKELPIGQQIERMIANFRELAAVAEDLGVVMAFENHMDYRISEIVQVVEAVDSPALRVNYDFANSWSVIEDQVEAARLAAPYTVMTHIKDMRVQPIVNSGEPAFFHAPIGYGDVEVGPILEILAARAPDPANLPQCLEVIPLADYDPDLWMRMSIDWLRERYPRLWTDRPGARR